jgi:hypothetical protein
MTDSELKNCPICNNDKINIKSRKGFVGTVHKTQYWRGYAKCSKGCVQTKQCSSPEEVKRLWNTRAKDPTHQLLVDALERISDGECNCNTRAAFEVCRCAEIIAEAALKAARGE